MLRTGDLRYAGARHVCQMFRAREVEELVTRCGGQLVASSASSWASLADPTAQRVLESDPEHWRRFINHEAAAGAEPGALDGGTHILFASR